MKINYFKPAILVLAVATLVSACSSMPTSTSLLDQARIDYVNAQNNPKVAQYAPLEMKMASEALESANKSASLQENAEKVNQLAYVAKQKIGVAQETAKQKSAEMDVQNSSKQRDQMRLDQRTNEADQAAANAEQAKRAAEKAQAETLLAQQKTQTAQMAQDRANAAQAAAQADTLLAQQKAQAARDEANAAQASNQQLQAQLSELAAKNTERGIVITLGDVLFATGSAQLSNDGLRTVEKLAAVLKKNPQRVVLVEGYTDSVGSEASNQQLSERRAKAVSTALLSMDLAANRVMVRGYGETYPVAGNANSQDRQLNRRVEIVLSDMDGKVKPRQ
jgi:outer membrane protein OmpA-like peptidoglycan-associated protein